MAVELFEKLKKGPIGDGTFVGFENAVLDRVPNASLVELDTPWFGYLIYAEGHQEGHRNHAERYYQPAGRQVERL